MIAMVYMPTIVGDQKSRRKYPKQIAKSRSGKALQPQVAGSGTIISYFALPLRIGPAAGNKEVDGHIRSDVRQPR